MENYFYTNEYDDDCVQVLDIKNNLQKTIYLEDEMDDSSMTSLGALLLLEKSTMKRAHSGGAEEDEFDEDFKVQRLSLAYEGLHTLPKVLMTEGITQYVKILDLSHNKFDNLDFLKEFHHLTSLICDHNNLTSNTTVPFLPLLELLWMNHCEIEELFPWSAKLKYSCPNLKYLSLMKNPLILLYSNNEHNNLDYRLYMISLFPFLIHLDDKIVSAKERQDAIRLYERPLLEKMVLKTQENLPEYLRMASQKVHLMFSSSPEVSTSKKRSVII